MNHIPSPMPEAQDGFIKTLNNMGYMTTFLDPCSQAFVNFAADAPGPVLEVGTAYGVATLPALAHGASVIANDIEAEHLAILRSRVPESMQQRLQTIVGFFPEDLEFANGQLGAVLISRVLHFFAGERIEASLAKVFSWLAPGGKLFVVAETPYLKNLTTFAPIYEERKARGEEWPGYTDEVSKFAPGRGVDVPKEMHFLDADVLRRVALKAGFRVESCALMARSDFPQDLQLDGREGVSLIAVKP